MASPSVPYLLRLLLVISLWRSAPGFVLPLPGSVHLPHEHAATQRTAAAASPTEGFLDIGAEKTKLMEIVSTTSMGTDEAVSASEEIDAIIARLESVGQGFQEAEVDGSWQLVYTRNSQGSPQLQKVFSKNQGFQNFDVGSKLFHNVVNILGGRVKVLADVAYEVNADKPERLEAEIVGAGVKLGPLRIPLPLKGRVGFLEFVYQDEDIRVTCGNRGGVFVHVRPQSILAPRGA